jgi:WD40 repeat protein
MKKVVWGALFVLLQVFGLQAVGDIKSFTPKSLVEIVASKIVRMYEDDEKIVLSCPTYNKDRERVGSKTYSLATFPEELKIPLRLVIFRYKDTGLFASTSEEFPGVLRAESLLDEKVRYVLGILLSVEQSLPGVKRDHLFATCSSDYRYVGWLLINEVLEVLDTTLNKSIFVLQVPAYFIGLNADGSLLVVVLHDGTMCLWDVASRACLWRTQLRQMAWLQKEWRCIEQETVAKVKVLEFSPLGYCFALVTDDGFFRIYDVDSGQMVKYSPANLPGNGALSRQDKPYLIKFSDDGLFVATKNRRNNWCCPVFVWKIEKKYSDLLEKLHCHVQQEPVLGPLGSLTELADALAAENPDDSCGPLWHLAGLADEVGNLQLDDGDGSYEDMPGLIAD